MEWVRETAQWIWSVDSVRFVLDALFKIALAALLGGIIGFEREHSHRPAGFRTHILVAVGAALVTLTSAYVAEKYEGTFNVDPMRMSAQVISGIGFLGAGTILREGFSVKGLTTAASLWAVSCIGISVGAGFVEGALVATVVIYFTLNSLKKVVAKGNAGKVLYIEVKNLEEQVPQLTALIRRAGATVHSMEILYDDASKLRKKKNTSTIKALIFPRSDASLNNIIASIQADESVVDVYAE